MIEQKRNFVVVAFEDTLASHRLPRFPGQCLNHDSNNEHSILIKYIPVRLNVDHVLEKTMALNQEPKENLLNDLAFNQTVPDPL